MTGVFKDPERRTAERDWSRSRFHFDDIENALPAPFITMTQDEYNDILLDAMAIR